jgi:flagella basal body P-ring formation protein FlgA
MSKSLLLASLVAAGLLAAAAPCAIAETLLLRPDITVDGNYVQLGDIIANAGTAGAVAVFRAPDLGATGTIQVARVLEAAREHALGPVETSGFTTVVVRRAGRLVGVDEIRHAIREALLARQFITEDARLSFDANLRPFAVESIAQSPAVAQDVALDPRSGRFEAHIRVPGSAIAARLDLRIGGSAGEMASIPVLAHAMGRGDIIKDSDIVTAKLRRAELAGDTVLDARRLAGMALRNPAKRGEALRDGDLVRPQLVERGNLITLVYEGRGISLTVKGKAMASGAQGEIVQVQNLTSKRIVEGRVSGPGRVSVQPAPQPITTASARQL